MYNSIIILMTVNSSRIIVANANRVLTIILSYSYIRTLDSGICTCVAIYAATTIIDATYSETKLNCIYIRRTINYLHIYARM